MTTTEGKLYLTAVRDLSKLEIQFVPKELTWGRKPSIADIEVIGRNNPLHHYTGGDTTLDFELDFLAEEANREDVMRKVRWIEALTYSDGDKDNPEKVLLTWGNMFRKNEVWVIKAFSARFSNFSIQYGFLPQQAYVKISLSLDTKTNLKREDVRWI